MATTAKQLSANFKLAAKSLESERKATLTRSALTAKKAIISERNKAVGSDGILSGANAKLGVRFDIKDGHETALVRALGPWQLIEEDTKSAGLIVGRKSSNNRRVYSRGTAASGASRRLGQRLKFFGGAKGTFVGLRPLGNGGGFGPYAKVRDKGTKGKHPFAKGVEAARAPVAAEMAESASDSVLKFFKGV